MSVHTRTRRVSPRQRARPQGRGPFRAASPLPRRRPARRRRTAVMECADVDVYYGDFRAVTGVNLDLRPQRDHCADRAVGLRQINAAAVAEPDERPRPRRPRRRSRSPFTARTSTPGRGCHRGAAADRDGVPEAEPVPEVDLRQRRLRPARDRHEAVQSMDDLVEEALTQAALWTEVKDKLKQSAFGLSGGQQQRLCIARTIAVKPEVILMDEPCSALDPIATARIEDLMEELAHAVHDRDRHPQHAAGCAGGRPDRLLHRFGQRRHRCPDRHAGRVRQDHEDLREPR